MADETATAAPVEASPVSSALAMSLSGSPSLISAQPADASEIEKPDESTQTNGETTTIEEKKDGSETAAEHAQIDEPAVDGEKTEASSVEPTADSASATNGKDKKKKPTGGVPEHKNKKLNKKKSMLSLHLNCQPGQFYWARLKGYPPWPAIICDEDMLPESLLASRPVSTARPDGTLRDDFKEGGKNAKERTFPIMFLSTNEL